MGIFKNVNFVMHIKVQFTKVKAQWVWSNSVTKEFQENVT